MKRRSSALLPAFAIAFWPGTVSTPATLERMNANLLGGDISGGAMTMRQFLLRPTALTYETSAPNLFLCSSSTPPGGGVHGMCGFRAAKVALRRIAIPMMDFAILRLHH